MIGARLARRGATAAGRKVIIPLALEHAAGGNGTSDNSGALSWTHTSAGGPNTVVIIAAALNVGLSSGVNAGNTTPTCTYGGVAATLLVKGDVGTNNSGATAIWAIWNPPTGAQTVSVSWSTSGSPTAAGGSSVSWVGCGGIGSTWSQGVSANSDYTVSSAAGRFLVHVGANQGSFGGSYSQTRVSDFTNDSRSQVVGYAAGASSVTFDWSGSGSRGHAVAELLAM